MEERPGARGARRRAAAATPVGVAPGNILLLVAALLCAAPRAAAQTQAATCYPGGTASTLPPLPLVAQYVDSASCDTTPTALCGGISCCGTNGANCVYGCLFCAVRARARLRRDAAARGDAAPLKP